MSIMERVSDLGRNRWARSVLIFVGGAAVTGALALEYKHENDIVEASRHQIAEIRSNVGPYIADAYLGADPLAEDDPRIVEIADLFESAESHRERRGWYALAGTGAAVATLMGPLCSLAIRPEAATRDIPGLVRVA